MSVVAAAEFISVGAVVGECQSELSRRSWTNRSGEQQQHLCGVGVVDQREPQRVGIESYSEPCGEGDFGPAHVITVNGSLQVESLGRSNPEAEQCVGAAVFQVDHFQSLADGIEDRDVHTLAGYPETIVIP